MTVLYHKRRTGHSIFQISINFVEIQNVRFRLVFPDKVTYRMIKIENFKGSRDRRDSLYSNKKYGHKK